MGQEEVEELLIEQRWVVVDGLGDNRTDLEYFAEDTSLATHIGYLNPIDWIIISGQRGQSY